MSQNMEEPDWVEPGVVKDEEDQSGSVGWNFADQRFGAFVFVVAGIMAFVLLVAMFLREFYWRKYGVDLCPSYRGGRRRQQNEQMDADREMAEELQRRLNEEEREAERLAKRKERLAWYENFIKDYTMTAKAEDLFYAHDVDDDSAEKLKGPPVVLPTGAEATRALKTISSISISDDEEIDDIESAVASEGVVEPVACDANEEDAHLYLRLPVKDCSGKCRTVDAHCAICFSEYEEGDKVVWSGLQCQHAFHDECILPWLSKGKKRCPICRHWFVPGTRIEDQKKEMEERLRLESSSDENGDSETSDETDRSESTSENEHSSSEIESGESETQIPAEASEATTPISLDVEAGVSSVKDHQDDSSVCLTQYQCDHNDKQTSSQEFGVESEELTEIRGLGALENV